MDLKFKEEIMRVTVMRMVTLLFLLAYTLL